MEEVAVLRQVELRTQRQLLQVAVKQTLPNHVRMVKFGPHLKINAFKMLILVIMEVRVHAAQMDVSGIQCHICVPLLTRTLMSY